MSVSFIELQRAAKRNCEVGSSTKLALLGDRTTQNLATAIKGCAQLQGIQLELFEADYNLIDSEVYNAASELYRFAPNFILLYMCSEKLYQIFCGTPFNQRDTFADNTYEQINNYWDRIKAHAKSRILQFTFVSLDDQVFGNYASKTRFSFVYQLARLNVLLMEGCQQNPHVFLVDLNAIQSSIGRKTLFDDRFYYLAKMPLTNRALPFVANSVLNVIQALQGRIKKCVVLDLDNTIWGGIIGDVGMSGIEIGELGRGAVFSALQTWLKELKQRGILLAVCSKNDETIAKEPFEKHPEMVLRMSDFSLFVANWNDKASNIRMIQNTLNIGMDSFVFLDDSPFERNLVKKLIPEVTVPELPNDPALFLSFLQDLKLFETASFSEEDTTRTHQYQVEVERQSLRCHHQSYEDYLKDLEMVVKVGTFNPFHIPRIAQLTQRSNQFNLRTVRYTESEITDITHSDKHATLFFSLKDKFGDHGVVAVVILEKQENRTLLVDTWVMSCRVLKRTLEAFIINYLIKTAKAEGFSKLLGEFIPTPKNSMVSSLYESFGFCSIGQNQFSLEVDHALLQPTFISE